MIETARWLCTGTRCRISRGYCRPTILAVALITTLYGALIANILAGPIADKLSVKDTDEVLVKTIVISGVMAIQSGDNPRVVESKLTTFLPPSRRDEVSVEEAA